MLYYEYQHVLCTLPLSSSKQKFGKSAIAASVDAVFTIWCIHVLWSTTLLEYSTPSCTWLELAQSVTQPSVQLHQIRCHYCKLYLRFIGEPRLWTAYVGVSLLLAIHVATHSWLVIQSVINVSISVEALLKSTDCSFVGGIIRGHDWRNCEWFDTAVRSGPCAAGVGVAAAVTTGSSARERGRGGPHIINNMVSSTQVWYTQDRQCPVSQSAFCMIALIGCRHS